jgi:DNA polymerase I
MPTYIWEDSTYYERPNKPTMILLFGRDIETNEVKRFGIENYKPYFYIADLNGELLNCYGGKISRVEFLTLKEMREARTLYKKQGVETFNSDIAVDYQFVIDKGIQYGFNEKLQPVETPVKLPKVLFFDIEVAIPSDKGIDETRDQYPIVAIGMSNTYTKERIIYTQGAGKKYNDTHTDFANEKELLVAFAEYVHKLDPDIITGWSSEDFDFPYIRNRARLLRADISGLSRLRTIYPSEYQLAGRSHPDMFLIYRDWSKPMGQLPSYGLKYVAKTFCDFVYDEQGAHICELIADDRWGDLIDYLTNDIIALEKINDRFRLITYHETLRKLMGVKMNDIIKRTVLIEILLLRQGMKPIPHKVNRERQTFEGAYVHPPTAGMKEWVACLDLKSLYPSIILAFDISPDIDKMIPKTITFVLNEREKLRAMRMAGTADDTVETSEQSLKYVANAFYGYLGSIYARLYYPEGAKLITKTGRDIALELRTYLETLGYHIEYGDTDSTFISPIRTVEEGEAVQALVNEYLKAWATRFNVKPEFAPIIKFEKLYDRILFKKKIGSEEAAKKKYVGNLIWKDGHVKDELSYTGIELKRSDATPITKKLMTEFFELVVRKGDVESAVALVSKTMKDVKAGRISLHDIGMPKAVNPNVSNTAWHKGKINGEKYLGIRFNQSDKPILLYCKSPAKMICINNETKQEDVIDKITVDWILMSDKVITSKMRSFVESVGVDWESAILGQKSWDDFINTYDRSDDE